LHQEFTHSKVIPFAWNFGRKVSRNSLDADRQKPHRQTVFISATGNENYNYQ
jgi:hypothetical protein